MKASDTLANARPARDMVSRYAETLPGCEIDLSDNTNLWGTPPSVQPLIAGAAITGLSRYPSAYSDDLKRELARYAGVDSSMIVVGCGSDDLLDSAIRSLAAPGETLAGLDPSFSMIPSFAAVSGLAFAGIPLLETGMADAFAEVSAGLSYLCSPNNPTGTVLQAEVIEAIVAGANGSVIVDEAYAEFAGATSVELAGRYDNVMITRTMSKAFGMAGFRVGYAIASPELICRVEAARGPYKVSSISEKVAMSVLQNDMEWVNERVVDAVTNRDRLAREFTGLGYTPLDSRANFLLVPVPDSASVETKMRTARVAVRSFGSLTGIGDAVRVTVGPWEMMERCLDAFGAAI